MANGREEFLFGRENTEARDGFAVLPRQINHFATEKGSKSRRNGQRSGRNEFYIGLLNKEKTSPIRVN